MSRSAVHRSLLVAACAAASAAPAQAHLVQTGFGSFYDGLAHPLVAPEDLLLVLGLGLLAGRSGKPEARLVLFALPLAWIAGCVAGFLGPALPASAWQTTVSFGLVGLLVAAFARVPRGLLSALTAAVGIVHGYENGATFDVDTGPALALAGVALAVFTLVTLSSALAVSARAEWARVAVRVAGSWFAAIGLLRAGWLLRA